MHSKGILDLQAYLTEKRAIVERALEAYFPEPEGPAFEVVRAMKYSLYAGVKPTSSLSHAPSN
jgi:hypothetical protein